jgi:hypothetical protein
VVQIHSLCSCSCSHFQIGRRFEFPSINEDLDGSSKPKPAFSAMSFAKRRLRLVEVRRITNWRFSSQKPLGSNRLATRCDLRSVFLRIFRSIFEKFARLCQKLQRLGKPPP